MDRGYHRRRSVQRLACRLIPSLALVTLAALPAAAADPAPAAAPAAKCDPYKNYDCLDDYLGSGIFERLYNYYDLEMGQAAAPADPKAPPSRRPEFPPAAMSTPPMPFTEWPYGGTEPLGATRTGSIDSPLMVAIANTSVGKWMGEKGIQVYGWVDVGANFSTSDASHGGNSPAAYLYNPNAIQLDQVVLYIDRFPDTVQKDHIDWGMRISGIYGENYRYTTAYGISSNQLLRSNNVNGYDFPMEWVEAFIPQIGDGLILRLGRFISLPDIEAQLAPNNYMYTHSMTYTFDNYTNTGLVGSLALGTNWIVQAAVTVGTEASISHLHDRFNNPYPNVPGTGPGQVGYNPLYPDATFKVDPGAMPTYTACIRWNADDGKTDTNICANGINSGEYGYNNLQWYGATFYHTFNDQWHVAWEGYHLFMRDVPNFSNPDVQTIYANGGAPFSSAFISYNAPNPAFKCPGGPSALKCTAGSYATTAYINYSPNPLNNFSIRPELFWDPEGQRTGTPTHYANFALGWQHWYSPQIEVRPELAYYHSFNGPAFNGNVFQAPNHNSETILSGDVIWHF